MPPAAPLLLFAALSAGLALGWWVAARRLAATRERAAALAAELAGSRQAASALAAEVDAGRQAASSLAEWREKAAALAAEAAAGRDAASALAAANQRIADLQAALAAAEARLEAAETAHGGLQDTFRSVASQALEEQARSFLTLAEQALSRARVESTTDLDARRDAVAGMVGPLAEGLERVQNQLRVLELARAESEAGLLAQVRGLSEAQRELRSETANLVNALRAPQVRGRWGELQLRRVVEVAGMVRHCDFDEQVTVLGPDGGLRPDLVIRLPGRKSVVVDAKVPLSAYLEAVEAPDEPARRRRLEVHARQVRSHIDSLAGKGYQHAFDPSPDLVVLFVPGDAILSAAAEADPSLFEHAAGRRVLLASPTTLIGLLHAVAHGWRQEAVAEHARQVCALGRELYQRLGTLGQHVERTGRALDKAVEAYNAAVGSLEARVFVSARKLADLDIAEGSLDPPSAVERTARPLAAPELRAG